MINISNGTLSEISDLNSLNEEHSKVQTTLKIEKFIDELWNDVLKKISHKKNTNSETDDTLSENESSYAQNFQGKFLYKSNLYQLKDLFKFSIANHSFVRGPRFSGKSEFLSSLQKSVPESWNFKNVSFFDNPDSFFKRKTEQLKDELILIDNVDEDGVREIVKTNLITIMAVKSPNIFFDTENSNEDSIYMTMISPEDFKVFELKENLEHLMKLQSFGLINSLYKSIPEEILIKEADSSQEEMLFNFFEYLLVNKENSCHLEIYQTNFFREFERNMEKLKRKEKLEQNSWKNLLEKFAKEPNKDSLASILEINHRSKERVAINLLITRENLFHLDLGDIQEIDKTRMNEAKTKSLKISIEFQAILDLENFEKLSALLDFLYSFVFEKIEFASLEMPPRNSSQEQVQRILEKMTFWLGSLLGTGCEEISFSNFFFFSENFAESWRLMRTGQDDLSSFVISDVLLKLFNNREFLKNFSVSFTKGQLDKLKESELEHVIEDISMLLKKLKKIKGFSLKFVNDSDEKNSSDFLINSFTNDLLMAVSCPIKDIQLNMEALTLEFPVFPCNEESVKRLLGVIDGSVMIQKITLSLGQFSPMCTEQDLNYFLNVLGCLMMCSQRLKEFHLILPGNLNFDEINRFIDCSFASESLKTCQLSLNFHDTSLSLAYLEGFKNTFIFSKMMKPLNILPKNDLFRFIVNFLVKKPLEDEYMRDLNEIVKEDYSGRLEFKMVL